jgi:hypothetical protein
MVLRKKLNNGAYGKISEKKIFGCKTLEGNGG